MQVKSVQNMEVNIFFVFINVSSNSLKKICYLSWNKFVCTRILFPLFTQLNGFKFLYLTVMLLFNIDHLLAKIEVVSNMAT